MTEPGLCPLKLCFYVLKGIQNRRVKKTLNESRMIPHLSFLVIPLLTQCDESFLILGGERSESLRSEAVWQLVALPLQLHTSLGSPVNGKQKQTK